MCKVPIFNLENLFEINAVANTADWVAVVASSLPLVSKKDATYAAPFTSLRRPLERCSPEVIWSLSFRMFIPCDEPNYVRN